MINISMTEENNKTCIHKTVTVAKGSLECRQCLKILTFEEWEQVKISLRNKNKNHAQKSS